MAKVINCGKCITYDRLVEIDHIIRSYRNNISVNNEDLIKQEESLIETIYGLVLALKQLNNIKKTE